MHHAGEDRCDECAVEDMMNVSGRECWVQAALCCELQRTVILKVREALVTVLHVRDTSDVELPFDVWCRSCLYDCRLVWVEDGFVRARMHRAWRIFTRSTYHTRSSDLFRFGLREDNELEGQTTGIKPTRHGCWFH